MEDSGIETYNRILKMQSNQKIATDLWGLAKKLSVEAEDEEAIVRNLEEMEVRDRRTKEEDNSKAVRKEQRLVILSYEYNVL